MALHLLSVLANQILLLHLLISTWILFSKQLLWNSLASYILLDLTITTSEYSLDLHDSFSPVSKNNDQNSENATVYFFIIIHTEVIQMLLLDSLTEI